MQVGTTEGITLERLPMIAHGQRSSVGSASYSTPQAAHPSALLSPLPPVGPSSIAPVSGRSIYRLPPLSDKPSVPLLEPTQVRALPPVSSIAPNLAQNPRNDHSVVTPRVDRLPVVTSPQRLNPREPTTERKSISAAPISAAAARQASKLITDAYRLADRGVFYSARADFEESLRIIAQARDGSLHDGDHEDFLAQALMALKEADDFLKLKSATIAGKRDEISHLIAAHRTAVLKDESRGAVSQGKALQRYYSLTHHHLLKACGREPIASAAMLGLGKVHAAMATETPSIASAAGAKAMVLYRTAIAADPANSMAANELGVTLARYGHLEQARDVLQQSVAISPHRAAWRNLSMVHHQLGETLSAAQAHQRSLAAPIAFAPLAGSGRNGSRVSVVSPEAFSRGGPMPNFATPKQSQRQVAPTNHQASTTPSWLSWARTR